MGLRRGGRGHHVFRPSEVRGTSWHGRAERLGDAPRAASRAAASSSASRRCSIASQSAGRAGIQGMHERRRGTDSVAPSACAARAAARERRTEIDATDDPPIRRRPPARRRTCGHGQDRLSRLPHQAQRRRSEDQPLRAAEPLGADDDSASPLSRRVEQGAAPARRRRRRASVPLGRGSTDGAHERTSRGHAPPIVRGTMRCRPATGRRRRAADRRR